MLFLNLERHHQTMEEWKVLSPAVFLLTERW